MTSRIIDWLPNWQVCPSHLSCTSCTLFFLSFLSHLLQTVFLPFQFCLSVRHIDRLDGKFEESRQIEIMIICRQNRKWNHLKKIKFYRSREWNENYYSDFRWNWKQTSFHRFSKIGNICSLSVGMEEEIFSFQNGNSVMKHS